MPTDNTSSGSLMWQDENGNWHPLEGVTIHADMCTISEEAEAMFWAIAEGLEIVKRGDINGDQC